MSNPKWTDEQKLAIEKNGNNILVAAAAGSGKTAVLVERIIQKIIKDKIDIDKLLVVTFTNAAAAEMRERILESIYKELDVNPNDEHLKKQIMLLGKASICTIHSFCLDVIRNYFYEIDLPANFKISSDEDIAILKQETLEDVLDDLYESEDEDFMKLVDTYASYKDDEKIRNLINTIYNFIQSNPFPMEWLNEKVEVFNKPENVKDFSECDFGKILIKDLSDKVYDAVCNYKVLQRRLEKLPEYPLMLNTIETEIDLLKVFYDKLQIGWDEAYDFKGPKSLEFPKWKADKDGSKDFIKEIKTKRDDIRDHIRKEIDRVLKYSSSAAYEDIYEMYDILNSLKQVIEKFEIEFKKRKKDKNTLDFSDIEHYALQILVQKNEEGLYVPTDVAKNYQDKFVEIAIDEYQDSNQIQEYILSKISKGNNIFMVGDVKQSIYRFRQACPELFMEKYNTYGENIIQLFKNFRSRKNILDFTNIIFKNIMSVEFGELDYTEKEYLNYGMVDYPEDDNSYSNPENAKTELLLIETKDEEQEVDIYKKAEEDEEQEDEQDIEDALQILEKEEIEANFVSQKIKEIINSKIKIYDKNLKELREVEYKDIVILLRQTATVAPIFEKTLTKNSIPVYSDANSEFIDSYEIQTVVNVLKIIDNPLDDIALVSTMRGEIGEFTDNELVEIRLFNKDSNYYNALIKAKNELKGDLGSKVNNFLEQFELWKIKAKYLSLAELIWDIYTVTGFYNYVSLMPNGNIRKNNLKKLFERAKAFENSSFKGLFDFIRFLQRVKTGNSDLSPAKLIGENENVVRIMSIHKSKGLEFPIVFLSNIGKQFNEMDLRQEILLHEKYGLGPQYINTEMNITYSTSSKDAIKIVNKKEAMSEEMRVLYVAVTRAREKLYITGTSKNIFDSINKKTELLNIYSRKNGKINPILLQKAKSYLDWILQVVQSKELENNIELKIINKKDIVQVEEINNDLRKFDFSKNINNEQIAKELNFEYSNYLATILPLKSTVSKIKELNEEDGLFDFTSGDQMVIDYSKLNESKEQKVFIKNELDFENSKPLFMQESNDLTGTQKGTVMHFVLEKIDFSRTYTKEELEEFVNGLVDNNYLTKEQVESIRLDKIQNFLESTIGKELLSAKKIFKEKPFVTKVLVKEIFKDIESDDYVLVQGIIDLFYQNSQGEWVLLDYKTDFVPDGDINILKKKYYKQLEIYKKALEDVLGTKVNHTYIYSLNINEKVEL